MLSDAPLSRGDEKGEWGGELETRHNKFLCVCVCVVVVCGGGGVTVELLTPDGVAVYPS